MQRNKIGFAGKGWGALAAVRGLQKYYDLLCLTQDTTVIGELSGQSIVISSFQEFSCNTIVCAGYEPIIGKELVTKYTIINIHYSLLPSYRGWHSTAWAIMNGEEKLGLSIFKMNQFMDDGPILHQKEFTNDNTSSATYYMNLMNLYVEENLGEVINQFHAGHLIPKEQIKKNASWTGKRGKTHNFIDFNKSFEHCKRLFRVLQYPYPSPQIKYKKNCYTIGKVGFHKSTVETDIGRILNVDDEGVWVNSQDGYIIMNNIEDMKGARINNNTFKIGTILND